MAIITPQATLTQDVADQAKDNWVEKYGGAGRVPAILPNGTQVIPLAWSPSSDSQLIEARHMSLTDVANLFNLDGYWLGAPVAGMTYKTAAPQYQQVLLTSLEPVLADFEQVWSDAWLPRGTHVQFGRDKLLREDLPTTATALSTLVAADIAIAGGVPVVPDGQPARPVRAGADPEAPAAGAAAGRCPARRRGPTTPEEEDRPNDRSSSGLCSSSATTPSSPSAGSPASEGPGGAVQHVGERRPVSGAVQAGRVRQVDHGRRRRRCR